MYISKNQTLALDKIKKINYLQQDELIDIVLAYTEKAIEVINERGGELEFDIAGTLTDLLKESGFGEFKRMFTQAEVPEVTLHTFKALDEKEFIETIEYEDGLGVVYYIWTGKELE